ncbi:hypothetical protein [Parvibaculum sp.]|uniref:hypothetical protein n=1 Tax=Parvibaculum sp. TaxID=2024848 RepID=UPI00391AD70B
MRILAALALTAAALASAPASAAGCAMDRVVYTLAGTNNVTLHFEDDAGGYSMNGLQGVITGGTGVRAQEMIFGWGNRGPATASPGGTVLAFNADFTSAAFPRSRDAEPPFALIFPQADDGWGDAWTFSHCR